MAATRAGVLLDNGRLQAAEALLRQDEDAPAALRLRLLLERGRFQDARKLAQELLPDAASHGADMLLPAVQAAIAGNDPALARQWLQSRTDGDNAEDRGTRDLANALLAAATGDHAAAERDFDAVEKAAEPSTPAEDARAGAALVIYLVGRGDLDRASSVMGSLTPFVDRDYRSARAALALYRALGDRGLREQAETRVRQLAGERDPNLPVVY
jgi:hypothetical protein